MKDYEKEFTFPIVDVSNDDIETKIKLWKDIYSSLVKFYPKKDPVNISRQTITNYYWETNQKIISTENAVEIINSSNKYCWKSK